MKQIADEIQVSKQAVWQRIKRNAELSAMFEGHSESVNGKIYVDELLEQHIKKLYPNRKHVDDVDGCVRCVDINKPDVDVNVDINMPGVDVNVDGNLYDSSTCVDEKPSHVDNSSTHVNSNSVYVDDNVDRPSTCVYSKSSDVDINVDAPSTQVDGNLSSVDINIEEPSTNVDTNLPHVDINMSGVDANVDGKSIDVDDNVYEASTRVDGNLHCVDINRSDIDVNTLIATLESTVNTLKHQLTVKDNQITELTSMLKASQEQQATLVAALSAAQALHAGTIKERLTDRFEDSEAQEDPVIDTSGEKKKKKNFFAKLFGRN